MSRAQPALIFADAVDITGGYLVDIPADVTPPVTLSNVEGAPARAYIDAARRLCGESVPMQVPAERKGFMDRLLGRRAA